MMRLLLSAFLLAATSGLVRTASAESSGTWAVRLVFGTEDRRSTDWSGRLVAPADLLARVQLEDWRFRESDRIVPNGRWECRTRLGVAPGTRRPVRRPGAVAEQQVPWPVGIILVGTGAEPDRLQIDTAQGGFAIPMAELAWGTTLAPMPGVSAERIVAPQPIGERDFAQNVHDDFPALLQRRNGGTWLAWIRYENGADRVLVSRRSEQGWSEPVAVTEPGDYQSIALAEDGERTLWAIYSRQTDGNWNVEARRYDDGRWSTAELLSNEPGPDINVRAASSADGHVCVVWQGFRDGQSDILLRRLAGGEWEEPVRVSPSRANDWLPAVAVDRAGTAHVAWDSYASGNYDVFVRSYGGSGLGPVVTVADTPRFEANASLACDLQGRVWVAYDEGTEQWGKDYGFWWWLKGWQPQGTPLYRARRFRVVCLDGKRRLAPADPFATLPAELQEYSEVPQIAVDDHGAPWVFFRNRTSLSPREDGWAARGWWELYGLRYSGDTWSAPIYFGRSMGRQEMQVALATDGPRIRAVWPTDNRTPGQPVTGIRLRLHAGTIETSLATAPALKRVSPSSVAPGESSPAGPAAIVHPNEAADLERIRNYRAEPADHGRLAIYRGDLHRHTELSLDGVGDGTLTDLYRYALDAATMDFILVGDHGMGQDREYPWWRTQKSNDLYRVGSRFVPLYGYERSVLYPWGHRNVIWAERGHRTLPISTPDGGSAPGTVQARAAEDDTFRLYAELDRTGGIATSHTSGTGQGTNWMTGFDPVLEPIVELFQGYHAAYESPDGPLSWKQGDVSVHGSFEPAGYVQNALAKGHRLGFQASSDHISTHVSYACVYAPSLDRRALVDAMRARHTYAATDNIILDVRSGPHFMGDEFSVAGAPALRVHVEGTAPIRKVEIVRDNQVIYSVEPGTATVVDFDFADMDASAATHYYYVRLQQVNYQTAWSSPMWITKTK